MVRVLHTLGTMDPGGVETWLLHVLRNIDRDRFQFHFCTFGTQPGLYAAEVERLGGKMIRCPKSANLWSFGHRFRRILHEGKYDAVHSHVHLFSGAVLRWAKAEGLPMRIAHSHTSNDGKPDTRPRIFYRSLMRSWIDHYATHGLAVSKHAAANLFGENWQTDTRFRVMHCGIDLHPFEERVAREDVRRELGISVNASVVGHVGRFVPAKNHRFLLEIAAEISKVRPDIHFLLVGDGPLRPEIEARAREMGFNGKMHFAGTRTDVPRLMRSAMDAFIFPSVWEGLPITLVEAQAAGLPCIFSGAVTEEANVLPQQVTQLSLTKTPKEWAERTFDALVQGRVPGDQAVQAIAQTDFCVHQSSIHLSNLYGGV